MTQYLCNEKHNKLRGITSMNYNLGCETNYVIRSKANNRMFLLYHFCENCCSFDDILLVQTIPATGIMYR